MARKKKLKIKLNDNDSLESLMQEVYNDSCLQINDSQKIVNELANMIHTESVDDLTKITREKSNALKIKETAIKLKLESGKLMSEIIKNHGDVLSGAEAYNEGNKVDNDNFAKIHELIKQNAQKNKNL